MILISLTFYFHFIITMNLTLIYSYIEQRLGVLQNRCNHFLISRTTPALAFLLHLVVIIYNDFVLMILKFPAVTVLICYFNISLSWRFENHHYYRYFHKTFFLVSSVFDDYFICNSLDLGFIDAFETVKTVIILKFFHEDYLKGTML